MASNDMYQQLYQKEGPPPYHPSALKQWAKRVIGYSSQYNNVGWSADQALGPPKVYPNHGDIQGAWASSVCDKNQFIELEFEIAVKPTAINIYETYNPGAVVCIKAKDNSHQWRVLWSSQGPTALRSSRIFSPNIPDLFTSFTVHQLRIEVDCTAARSWCEIDAVELVGIRPGAVTPVDDTQFFEDMKLLINNKLFHDTEINIDNSRVYAHKAILAARSPFFSKMFVEKQDEKVQLRLPNVSKTDLLAALSFIYTNRLPPDCSIDTLINLSKTAWRFELVDMNTAAIYKLTEMVTCENVIPIFKAAEKEPELDELKSMCIKFMGENLKEMSLIPDFETLPQKYLVEIVQNATAAMCTRN